MKTVKDFKIEDSDNDTIIEKNPEITKSQIIEELIKKVELENSVITEKEHVDLIIHNGTKENITKRVNDYFSDREAVK